ncbi:MAG: hypothetical protein ACM3KR_03100 [Deltaproteobacteria bacterium]
MPNSVLIKGPTGSGKTKKLIDEYQKLLEQGKRTDSILVLVRNRRQSIIWRKSIKIRKASAVRIQSYFGFIQGEIKKYWSLISSDIDGFKKETLEPVFLTTEVSQYILNKFVDEFRRQGRFADTTSTSEKITIEALSVLSRAAASRMDIHLAGKRLFDANPKKDLSRERLFADLQDVICRFVEYCKENGYIDYFLAVEIYNKKLLESKAYIERLNKEVKCLIVDDAEEAVPCETYLISHIMDYAEKAVISFSTDGAFSRKQGACPEYAEKIIFPKCAETIELKESYSCKPEFMDLSERVCGLILENKAIEINHNSEITFNSIQTELRSEMISMVCVEVQKYLEKGGKPADIAIISPIVDSVLEYCLESWFAKKGVSVVNLSRTRSYMEDRFISGLVTLACLSHPGWNINPPGHDISNLLSMVLGLDPVRSAILAREVMAQKPFTLPEIEKLEFRERIGFVNTERYYYLKNWIEAYRKEEPESIAVFFQKALRTIFLNIPMIEEHINSCRILIESAETFTKMIGQMAGANTSKAFIEMIKKGVKPAETITELEQKLYTEAILLSTPYAYISSSLNRKTQIWMDISSQLWCKSDAEQLSNPYVFSPDWQEDQLWTENMDERFRLLKFSVFAKRLMRTCSDRIVFAESQYNQDGYEND